MKIGDTASVRRRIAADAVNRYVALGGAAEAPLAVPEPLIMALFSYLLGTRLPGQGTNYLKQDLSFARAAQIGEMLTAKVTVTRIRADKCLVDLHTVCSGESGEVVCSGRALVYVGDAAAATAQ